MKKDLLTLYWAAVTQQNALEIKKYFAENAYIRWNNTNEQFTVDEFLIANCEYPGSWKHEIERIEGMGNLSITVVKVWRVDVSICFHVTSFFEFEQDKIKALNEYWGDDGIAPEWRLNKKIGKPIK